MCATVQGVMYTGQSECIDTRQTAHKKSAARGDRGDGSPFLSALAHTLGHKRFESVMSRATFCV